jgi:arylsulfatase A-like enzyme
VTSVEQAASGRPGSQSPGSDTADVGQGTNAAAHVPWLLLAVSAGLLAGWLELAFTQAPAFVGHLVFSNRDTWWVTPLSYLVFLIPVGAVAALVRRLVPSIVTVQAQIFLQLLPAVFGVWWLLFPRIHRYAIVLLALGITYQIARVAGSRVASLRRWIPRAAAILGTVTAVSAALAFGGPAISEWRSLRALPAPAPGAPNVLLLILDTVRAKSLSLYGYSRPTTPFLTEFARQGVVFENAYSTAPWTLPSHASIFTGRYPYELSADWRLPLDHAQPVLAEVFQNAGYRTGGFVANLEYTSRETGLSRGFIHYEDWPITPGRIASESSLGLFIVNNPGLRRRLGFFEPLTRRWAGDIEAHFLRWVRRTEDSRRPFFAFLNLYDAHEPYLPPQPYRAKFGAEEARERKLQFVKANGAFRSPTDELTPEEFDQERRAYDGGIAYIDAVIADLMRSLANSHQLDSTIVVITADHGEHIGEFGLRSHGVGLYPQALHVPLLIVDPRSKVQSVRIDSAVTLRDLAATVLDVAGLPSSGITGHSMAPRWAGAAGTTPQSPILSEVWPPANPAPSLPVDFGYMRSLVVWPHQLIRRGDGKAEMLNLSVSDTTLASDGGSLGVQPLLLRELEGVPPNRFPGRHDARVPAASPASPARP